MLQDLRYAVRLLLRTPAFTVAAVSIMAAGLGASAAIFTLVERLVLAPLPYAEPERLVRIFETFGKQQGTGSVSYPNLQDWRREAKLVEGLAAAMAGSRNLTDGGEPERVSAVELEAVGWRTLGARPLLGRVFRDGEDGERSVLMSESLWRTRFGGDARIVGRTIQVDGQARTVVGVMPAGFVFPPGERTPVGLWLPFTGVESQNRVRGSHYLMVIGRLKSGATLEQAGEELKAIAGRIESRYPGDQGLRSALVRPLSQDGMVRVRRLLWILMAAVGLVFLIGCANVANLLLVRAGGRRREVAIRTALGAGRAALMRQFLMESLLFSLAGGLLGALLAIWGVEGLLKLGADWLPRAETIRVNFNVLAFLAALSVLGGLLFGLAPAWRGARVDVNEALKAVAGRGLAGGAGRGLRGGLVAVEVGLSLLLLLGAGLMLRTLANLHAQPLGFDPDHVLTMRLALSKQRYAGESGARFLDRLEEEVRQIPGVTGAGLISLLPLQEYGWNGNFGIVGRPPAPRGEEPFAEFRFVTDGYFDAMRLGVRQGRTPGRMDTKKSPAVVVNETLAKQYFAPGAIGQRLLLGDPAGVPIAGVVADARQWTLDEKPRAELYVPARLAGINQYGSMSLVVRTQLPPEQALTAVRARLRQLDPEQPLYLVKSMREVISDSVANQGKLFWLLAGFAALALALALAGIYGVISYLVQQRTQEFGVRAALGASGWQLMRQVMGEAGWMLGAGLALGWLAAVGLGRFLESFLFGVKPLDAWMMLAAALLLVVVALAAVVVPARRASRVDPMVALRYE